MSRVCLLKIDWFTDWKLSGSDLSFTGSLPNAHSIQGLKEESGIPPCSPTWATRTQELETLSAASQVHNQKVGSQMEVRLVPKLSDMACRHPKKGFTWPMFSSSVASPKRRDTVL